MPTNDIINNITNTSTAPNALDLAASISFIPVTKKGCVDKRVYTNKRKRIPLRE